MSSSKKWSPPVGASLDVCMETTARSGDIRTPLISQTGSERIRRATHVLQRFAFQMRRKMGHEREDARFDSMVRGKITHITFFSMLGVASMIAMDTLPWYTGIPTDNVYENATSQYQMTALLALQIIVSTSTLVTLGLIVQYYHLLVMRKRKEWSGTDFSPQPLYQEKMAERIKRERERDIMIHAYSFWASDTMKWRMLVELLIHVVHPIIFLSSDADFFQACKVIMLFRFYIWFKFAHLNSAAYKHRFEIVNHSDDFRSMNLKITHSLTLKTLLTTHTAAVVIGWALFTGVLGGFGMFMVERDADSTEPWVAEPIDWAGSMGNSLWFAWVTATTIGYGDYWPSTFKGRIMTVAIGVAGFIATNVFQALLTNQLKPTKNEKYIREYLETGKARDDFRRSAATLIQRAWRLRRATRMRGRDMPVFHKYSILFGAVKKLREDRFRVRHNIEGSSDVVLEDAIEELMYEANEVGASLQHQRDELLTLHKKVHRYLRQIRVKTLAKKQNEFRFAT